jgi:hypothetical protein
LIAVWGVEQAARPTVAVTRASAGVTRFMVLVSRGEGGRCRKQHREHE